MYGGCTKTAIHAPFNTPTTATSTANDIVNTANAVSGQSTGGARTITGGGNDQIQMAAANPSQTGLDQQQQQQAAASSSTPVAHHSQHQQQQQQHPLHHQHLPHQQCNCYLPVLKPDVLLNTDRGLFKVYCFIKEFIGASGTSAVAIDNKIEQAMDLVKSHLMIAVREEVEVLKEKISELMDKINQLEVENTLLKANISQETLQQLQMQTQLQIAGSGQTAGNNMITAPPQPPPSTAAAVAAAAGTPATVTAQNVAANNASNANNQVAPNNISNSNGSAATAEGSGSATPTAAAAPVAENQNIANSGQSNNANNTSEANNASNGTATGSVVTAGNTNGPMS